MKKLTTPILYLLFIAVILVGCKDDEGKSSKTDLLTAKSWHATKIEFTVDGITVDATDDAPECADDDSIVFHKDGKLEVKMGTTKCDVDEEDEAGTWAWKDNETKVVSTVDGNAEEWTLVSLTSTTLKVSFTDDDLLPGAVIIITYTAI